MPLMAEGEFALVTGRLEKALSLSGQPVKRGTMAHEHIVYMMMVDSMCIAEDRAAIERFAPKLLALAERDEHMPYLAVARRAQGVAHRLAGDFEAAEEQLQAALATFSERNMPWQTGRTLVELGKLESARGVKEKARGYFNESLASFELIGAAPIIESTSMELEGIQGGD